MVDFIALLGIFLYVCNIIKSLTGRNMFSFNNFPILPKPFSPTLFSVLFVIFVEMAMKKSILKEGYKIRIALPAISYARKRIG